MTLFEELCKAVGAAQNSEAEEVLNSIVDDLIFESDMNDNVIFAEALKRFNEQI